MMSADQRAAFGISAKLTRGWPQRYGIALIAVVIAAVIRHSLDLVLGPIPPFILFVPIITLVALWFGFGPGLFATVVSTVIAGYFLTGSLHAFANLKTTHLIGLALFAIVGVAISAIGDLFRTRTQRLREFEKAVEGVEEMIVVVDRDYRYLIANRAFLRYRGTKREDLIGRRVPERFDPSVFENTVKQKLDECFAGKIVQFEMRYPSLQPEGRDLLISYSPIAGPYGIDRVAVVMNDITEKKQTEQALVRREEAYRQFLEQSSEGIFREELDAPVPIDLPEDDLVAHIFNDSYLAECNDAMARMYGFDSSHDLLGKRLTEMLAANDPHNVELTREYIRSGFRVIDRESHEVDIFGNPKIFRNSMTGIVVDGRLVRTWGIQRDVTEQVKLEQARSDAEAASKKSEAHFRALVEQAPDGIFIADAKGRYLDTNTAGAEMLGYTREEVLELSIPEILAEGEPTRLESEIARFADGATVRSEWKFRRKDGTFFHGEVSGKQLSDARLQAILRDMTERKHAEEEMRRSEERFRVALKDSPITVFNQDTELRYTWIYNPQLYWQHEIVGKTDDEILGTKRAANLIELKKKVLRTATSLREEVTVSENGKRHAFDVTIEPLFDSDGQVAGITGACMDIARLREIADRLQDAKDRLTREKSYLEGEIQTEMGFEKIIGQSPSLRDVLRKARIVAPTDSTVLLLGETGTGKELVARSVHGLSSRRYKTFVKLNCAAVPSGLLESELFGHEKGAFTSAVSQKLGRIELADKGTLFLDEISELPLELQPKLLRVLQDREFERLGGVRTLHVDVRIIAATNRDLRQDIADRKFREDLFYRLNVFPIELPPLRERRGDMCILVQHFVQKHCARMRKQIDTIPEDILRVLDNWNWPGNIRELENMIERMVILTKGRVLAAPPAELQIAPQLANGSLTEMEREHIIRVLRETDGVLSGVNGAANRLGLKRTTLQSKLKRFNIELHEYRRGRNGTYAD
jgi:PAS domain S-box-containing protein